MEVWLARERCLRQPRRAVYETKQRVLDPSTEENSQGWWCARRDYRRGVQGLVEAFPNADYYLSVDQNTVVFPHMLRRMVGRMRTFSSAIQFT